MHGRRAVNKTTVLCLRIILKYGYVSVKSMTTTHAALNAINLILLGKKLEEHLYNRNSIHLETGAVLDI